MSDNRRPSDVWVDPEVSIDVGDVIMGNVSIVGPVSVAGNVTISDSKGFIGLVTLGGGTAWTDPKVFIGLVTVGGIGTVTLSDPKGFVGLVSVGGGTINPNPSYSYKTFTSVSTLLVKSGAGVLHSFTVGNTSGPSVTFWDSAVPSGTKLMGISQNYPRGSYRLDATFTNGLSLDAITGGAGDIVPDITVTYS